MNRRQFAGVALAAAGAPSSIPASALGLNGATPPSDRIVMASIGVGGQGKDMYFEKPMGLSVEQGKAMRAAVRRHGVVFQFGTRQRSDAHFRFACELVRNGRIGELQIIILGAAWGVHDTDIAQWVADADHTGPVEIEGTAKFPKDGFYDTAPAWEVEQKYASGMRLLNCDRATALRRAWQFKMIGMGVLFQGSQGWIAVSRQGMEAYPQSLKTARLGSDDIRLPRSDDHRRDPISNIESAVRSDTVCQQADIAMRSPWHL
jgi:hypothetical protein